MSRWLVGVVLAGVVVVVGGVVFLAWQGTPAAAPGDPVITVSRSSCGQGWTDPRPGVQSFQVHNTGSVTAEADLVDPTTGTVYGEVEGLGPGTTRTLQVTLGNGVYAFRCTPEETDPITGPSVTITGGDDRSGPAVVPVSRNDLLGPLRDYQAYVATGLDTLAGQADALRDAVHRGDRAGSEAAWLTAHLTYERLGAAYDAFGDSDGAINGTADGLPGGTADEGFTGFHRLENGLWHNEDLAALAPVADQLDADVHQLRTDLPTLQVDPNDLGLRAHEILENTLQFELTGRTDYGSGTTLATALANLDGTREVLTVLRPVLAPRMPMSDVDTWLDRTDRALHTAQRPDGTWTPVTQLSREQREKIDGAVSGLVERLAPIAAITEPRRVP
ncbi:iron uptake system component EfeO [Amycolatopsis sacchari]|uniref:Iron uptake system component EfeO n=1 Tax=Amycolatopsis sacchari TaxID=115433 RepID=A0A1I3JBI5_9PSEU|nr:iron uptake system component EfeO [Amycolatopsis sacchari]